MDKTLCKLTLICPKAIETVIVDCLDSLEPSLSGYTVLEGQGRGELAKLASPSERVKGAMRTSMFVIILLQKDIDAIFSSIISVVSTPHITYWVEPVNDFGHLV